MARVPRHHPYSDRASFERLVLLIATIAQHPGVGAPEFADEPSENHHQAMQQVHEQLQQFANEQGYSLPQYSRSPYIDIKILKKYGVLQDIMHPQGYYLETGASKFMDLRNPLHKVRLVVIILMVNDAIR
jgi:hypothetical protein